MTIDLISQLLLEHDSLWIYILLISHLLIEDNIESICSQFMKVSQFVVSNTQFTFKGMAVIVIFSRIFRYETYSSFKSVLYHLSPSICNYKIICIMPFYLFLCIYSFTMLPSFQLAFLVVPCCYEFLQEFSNHKQSTSNHIYDCIIAQNDTNIYEKWIKSVNTENRYVDINLKSLKSFLLSQHSFLSLFSLFRKAFINPALVFPQPVKPLII